MAELLLFLHRESVSFISLLKFSVLPIAKVLVMCGLGFLVATPYINILSSNGRKLLSKLIFVLFLPCLIFTQLGKAITFQKLLQWWFIPVNVLLASATGCLLGLIMALIISPPPGFFKFTVVMIGIGNIGNIPLVLIGAVCRDKNNPFGDSDKCNEDGVAYISFGQWVGAVVVYTFVYYMLSPPYMLKGVKGSKFDIETPNTQLLSNEHENAEMFFLLNEIDWKAKVFRQLNFVLDSLKIKQILQPPVIASILALIVGCTPFLNNFLLADGAPFFFLTDGLNILGGAMIPCIMLVLGGNLIGGPGSSQLGLRTTVVITCTRLLVVPASGLGIVYLADKFGCLPPDDKMFRFVLLLQHTMPTSILAGAVASLRGVAEKEASAVLFWEHIFAVVSITGWMILQFKFLFAS